MKNKLMIVPLIALVLSAFAFGSTAAKGPQPPAQPGSGQSRGSGNLVRGAQMGTAQATVLHDYISAALADQLGLTVEQVEQAFDSGESLYDIALENGILEADLPSFLSIVHTAALEQAVADGVITQQQADRMYQRLERSSFGYGEGDYDGIPDGIAPQDGTGYAHGRGGNSSRGTCTP